MKKGILKLSVLFVALFIGIIGANALSIPDTKQCIQPSLAQPHMECGMYIEIDPDEVVKTGDTFRITLYDATHIQNKLILVEMQTGWELVGFDDPHSFTFNLNTEEPVFEIKYVGTDDLTGATVQFATGSYDKDDTTTSNCGFKYGFKATACQVYATGYFGKDGRFLGNLEDDTAKATYYLECFVCKTPTDEGTDGYWHGSDGAPTTEDEYYKQCMSCLTPDKASDGKYHGLNGRETDEAGYKKECTKYCKTPDESGDGKYYCKDGEECTEAKYKEECLENPKSGSFIPYAGIAAGVILIVTSTIMVKKQTKLRKI